MDALSKIKSQIEYYKLPENAEDKFKKIIDSMWQKAINFRVESISMYLRKLKSA